MKTVLTVLLSTALLINVALADDDDDDKPAKKASAVVSLDSKAQQKTGIETLKLKPATYHAEFTAYGKVLNIQPLAELRHRYLTALTEHAAAQAKFKQAELATARQQTLYEQGVSAKRNLEDHQAQWQVDKAQLQAARFQDQIIKQEAELAWGKTLSDWIFADIHNKLQALLSGQKKLLQITLPANQQLADGLTHIMIASAGNRSKAQVAELIATAPQTDNSSQGNSYFFSTAAKNLSIGMAITAWISDPNSQLSGVMIPKSALLWSLDQALVYVKNKDTFNRRAINHYTLTNDGYFVSEGLKPDEELVITGGQQLLSEQMRGQIPDED
jgi:multidrug efflux pump subunit AcrA (membrane-fusion protein)